MLETENEVVFNALTDKKTKKYLKKISMAYILISDYRILKQ